jgi:hypothetical protein
LTSVASVVSYLITGDWLASYWLAIAVVGSVICTLLWQRKSVRKVIADYPTKGKKQTHLGENFDRILSRYVSYARSANAIDELREDFDRCPWGRSSDVVPFMNDGRIRFRQYWFAGNHSDVGGSYPEAESRLSDISLAWMIEEALSLPFPLKIGPVFVNGEKVPGSAEHGEALRLFPSPGGVQHCEVAATKDFIAHVTPRWLKRATANLGYTVKARTIDPKAVLHPSVYERFALAEVRQCAGCGAYRPKQLQSHLRCQSYYPRADDDRADATAPVDS